jgi:hypothetical protein
MSSIQPNDGGGEVYGGEKVARGLVEAGCDGAILLEPGKAVFDQMPRFVVVREELAFKRKLLAGLLRL